MEWLTPKAKDKLKDNAITFLLMITASGIVSFFVSKRAINKAFDYSLEGSSDSFDFNSQWR